MPQARDCRGALSFVQNGDDTLPFDVRRVFWIYNVPERQHRGCHAHRTCSEMLLALHGAVDVKIQTATECVTYHLDNPRTGLFIEPMCWCELMNFSGDAVCLCLSDQDYDEDGYVNDFEEWKREVQGK